MISTWLAVQDAAETFDIHDPEVRQAMLVWVGGLALVGVVLWRRFGRRLLARPGLAPVEPAWQGADLFVTIWLGILGLFVSNGLLHLWVGAAAVEEGEFGALPVLVSTAVFQGLAAAPALFMLTRRPTARRALGFPGRPDGRWLMTALGLYLCSLPLLYAINLGWALLHEYLGQPLEPQAVGELVAGVDRASLWLVVVLTVLVVPFLEELLFRSWLQVWLVARLGVLAGITLTSLAFALLHGYTAGPGIFALALLLGAVRHRSGRLAPAFLLHAVNNGVTVTLLLAGESLTP